MLTATVGEATRELAFVLDGERSRLGLAKLTMKPRLVPWTGPLPAERRGSLGIPDDGLPPRRLRKRHGQFAMLEVGTAMARRLRYQRRRPDQTALYQVVPDHLETFYAALQEGFVSARLPAFVRAELEGYLARGLLCRGVVLLVCTECGETQVVALSCKGRGFCPSCLGRRMAQTAASLVDYVLPPEVPLRQQGRHPPVSAQGPGGRRAPTSARSRPRSPETRRAPAERRREPDHLRRGSGRESDSLRTDVKRSAVAAWVARVSASTLTSKRICVSSPSVVLARRPPDPFEA